MPKIEEEKSYIYIQLIINRHDSSHHFEKHSQLIKEKKKIYQKKPGRITRKKVAEYKINCVSLPYSLQF